LLKCTKPQITAPALKCGVWVVDVLSGQTVGFLEFQGGVTELFDVQVLPGIRFPAVVGFQKETIHGIFVVPRQAASSSTDAGVNPAS
jgi:hypothetical protein